MPDIDKLSIQIEAESTQAADRVNALANALERLKPSVKGSGSGFTTLSKKLESLISATNGLTASTKKLGNLATVLNNLSTVSKVNIPKTLPDRLVDIAAAADLMSDSSVANLDKMTSSLQRLSGVDLKWLPSAMRSSAKGVVSSAEAGITVPVAADTAGVDPAAQVIDDLKKNLDEIGEKETKISVNSSDVDKTTRKVGILSNALRAVRRIAFYRAIRAGMKMVSEAFSTGIKDLYQYSKALDGNFAGSMDKLSTSALYLKNSLGAMVSPLITAIAPLVDMLVDKFVNLLNIINQVFSALSGKTTYTKAIKQTQEYAEAANGAAKAARSFALGIDELNVIEPTTGGAGGAVADYGSMFEEEEISNDILDVTEKLKPLLPIVKAIGAGFAGWAIASSLIPDLGTLDVLLGSLAVAVGVSLLIDSIDKISIDGELTWENILEGAAGGAIAGGGLGLILAKALGLSWVKSMLTGAVIGLGISLVVMSIVSAVSGELTWEALLTGGIGGVVAGLGLYSILGKALGLTLSESMLVGGVIGIGVTLIASSVKAQAEEGLTWENVLKGGAGGVLTGYGLSKALINKIGLWPGYGAILGGSIAIGVQLWAEFFEAAAEEGLTWHTFLLGGGAGVLTAGGLLGVLAPLLGMTVAGAALTGGVIALSITGLCSLLLKVSETKWAKDSATAIAASVSNLNVSMPSTSFAAAQDPARKQNTNTIGTSSYGAMAQYKEQEKKPTYKYGGARAAGGFVDSGQIFIAREAGPELVGTIGNKTAVANNSQIVEGIQRGVQDANQEQNALLREQNELLTRILAKTGVTISGKTIKSAYDKATREAGASIMAGGVMA